MTGLVLASLKMALAIRAFLHLFSKPNSSPPSMVLHCKQCTGSMRWGSLGRGSLGWGTMHCRQCKANEGVAIESHGALEACETFPYKACHCRASLTRGEKRKLPMRNYT